MHVFGQVQKEVMEWAITNKPDLARDWLNKLESIRWKNYLVPDEAESIVSKMEPKAPWSREQWVSVMQKHGYPLEEQPYYNQCALYVVMSMIYSDSFKTISKFMTGGDVFEVIYSLALDKLKDKDEKFNVRSYFGL